MCRRTITTASCGHDLGWILVQCQHIRDRRAENIHCPGLFVRGAQYIFLNGPCGRCVRETHGHEDCSESNDEEEHGSSNNGSGSDGEIKDDRRANHHTNGGQVSDVTRLHGPAYDETDGRTEPPWNTYRYEARGLSPVPESAELTQATTSSTTVQPDSSASQHQQTAVSIDLERRRLLRTVRAHRRLRSEDFDDAPSVNSYHASLRGGADDGEDFDNEEGYRRVMDESIRARQQPIGSFIDESSELGQGNGGQCEEDDIPRVLEASRQENDAALAAQEEQDVQRLLQQSAQDQATLSSQQDAGLVSIIEQSAQDAKLATEAEENRMLELIIKLSLQEHPPQSKEDFMDEVARATSVSSREYMNRYGEYLSPVWREQYDDLVRKGFESSRAGSSDGVTSPPGHNEPEIWIRRGGEHEREGSVGVPMVSVPIGSRSGSLNSASQGQSSRSEDMARPTSTTAPSPGPSASASTPRPSERPALRRAGPRGPEPLGQSTTSNLYQQYPDDAAAAAREAALLRHRQSAPAAERQMKFKEDTEDEDERVHWWKNAAKEP